jgi:SSS family solute:Na+ symporter
MGAMLCLPVWTAFMFIGSLLWAFYKLSGEHLPASITKSDQIFPHFMVTQMPPGVAGLFLAALAGAAMSMLASDLNCLSVIFVEDFYGHFAPGRSDRQRLRVGKITVAVSGLLAIGVAVLLSHTHGSALSLYYLATAIVAGGLAGLFLLAFLVRRAGRTAALIAIAANLIFTAWATLTMNGGKTWNLHGANYPWHEFTIGAVGNTLMFVVGYLVSIIHPVDRVGAATLWDWISGNREAECEEKLGDRDESLAQSR